MFLQEFIIVQPTMFFCRLFNRSFVFISGKIGRQIVGKPVRSSFAILLRTKQMTFSFTMSDWRRQHFVLRILHAVAVTFVLCQTANSLLDVSAHHATQMPDEPHPLRKPRPLAVQTRINAFFDANNCDNLLRTHQHTASRASSQTIDRTNDRSKCNGRRRRQHAAVNAVAEAAISTCCLLLCCLALSFGKKK